MFNMKFVIESLKLMKRKIRSSGWPYASHCLGGQILLFSFIPHALFEGENSVVVDLNIGETDPE
jgi:hypothetical protein